MVAKADFDRIVKLVESWSIADREALIAYLRQQVHASDSTTSTSRPSFERALGIARGAGPAPTDEEVKGWIDEYRMEKYGK